MSFSIHGYSEPRTGRQPLRDRASALLVRLVTRLRRLRRVECWWRGDHRVAWRGADWECQRCLERIRAAPPPGALLTDEPMRHIYQTQPDGSIRRLDKVKGGKKARRRNVEEAARVKRLRKRLLGDQGE